MVPACKIGTLAAIVLLTANPLESAAEIDELVQARLNVLERRIEQLEVTSQVDPAPEYGLDAKVRQAASWVAGPRQICENPSQYPTIEFSGFLQLDSGWVSQSAGNIASVGDINSTTGLRRTRLRADGRVREEVSYVVDFDFSAGGHPSFRDVKFAIHDVGTANQLQIGYFQQPFGFDAMTSGRELLLLERQLAFAFAPFRQVGIGADGTVLEDRMSWSVSGFRFPTDSFGVSQGGGGGWGYAQRITALPVIDEAADSLIHIGGSYSVVSPGTETVEFAIAPGFFVVDPSTVGDVVPAFVDTGPIATDLMNLFGAEVAFQRGSLNGQAEVAFALLDQTTGGSLLFSGLSTKLAYVLTGEVHPYDRSRGAFTRLAPYQPGRLLEVFTGAWEVVAGWSYIDLADGSIRGGEMQTVIVGLNHYLNESVKLQFNVIKALLDDDAGGQSSATLAVIRAQVEF